MPGPDTISFTLNKTKTLVSTIAAIVGGVVITIGGLSAAVNWAIDSRVEQMLKQIAEQEHGPFMHAIEDKIVEVAQTVVDDDIAWQNMRIKAVEDRLERLEEE